MLAASLLVAVLGFAAFVTVRKLLPKIRPGAGKQICVLETAHLGPRRAVYLLRVGSMKLLLGTSREGLVKLEDVTAAFPPSYDEIAGKFAHGPGAEAMSDAEPLGRLKTSNSSL